jgi:hypothetical protein
LPHETAVAFHIGGEDRGQLSFDGARFQPRHLPGESIDPIKSEIGGFLRPFWEPLVSNVEPGQGFLRLIEIAAERARQRSFRDLPLQPLRDSRSRRAGLGESKDAMLFARRSCSVERLRKTFGSPLTSPASSMVKHRSAMLYFSDARDGTESGSRRPEQ